MSRGGGEEGFLSRWSRRKREAAEVPARAAGEDAEAPLAPGAGAEAAAGAAPPPDAAAGEEAALPSSGTDPAAEPFDPASLPPVESLTADSDFAAFLRDEVPAALRRAALRRAWTLDPAIRDFIGPADYAWDYNAPAGVPGFSLDLPHDLERLVAQAIGSAPPPVEGEPERGEEAPLPAEAAAPSPEEPASIQNPPRDTPLAQAPVDGPAPDALPAPAAPIAETPPVRRRHGGALPS
jgi:hypothetical protein